MRYYGILFYKESSDGSVHTWMDNAIYTSELEGKASVAARNAPYDVNGVLKQHARQRLAVLVEINSIE